MRKTIFVLLDACQYEAGTRNMGYLEHLIDYEKGAKYKIRGELPSLSRPMYATLLTGLPVCMHGIAANETGCWSATVFFPCASHREASRQPRPIPGSASCTMTRRFGRTGIESGSMPEA